MIVALLAVGVGATILSGLITIYYDIPRQMGQEFRSYGANLILVPGEGLSSLSPEMVAQAAAYFPATEIIGVAPYRYHEVKVNEQPFMTAGTELNEVKKTSPFWFVQGRWPQTQREVLIGQEVADHIRLLPGSIFTINGTNALGEKIDEEYSVVGILQTGGAEEAFIFMSFHDFEDMMAEGGKIDVVECSVSATGETMRIIAEEISAALPGVEARLVKRVTESEGTVLTKLQTLIYLVTVIVLLLIMICVATTMMAVVAERRKEIGLKKALGASNESLMIEFMGEGMFLGAAGGIIGAIFGFIFAQEVSVHVFSRSVSFRPLFILITLGVSVIITCLACLLPVHSATGVDPAIVLRDE
jgi:putative ABC transport system permease protein